MGIPLLRGRTFAEATRPKSGMWRSSTNSWRANTGRMATRSAPKSGRGRIRSRLHDRRRRGERQRPETSPTNSIGQIYFHYKQFVPRAMYLIVKSDRDDAIYARSRPAHSAKRSRDAPVRCPRMPQRLAASMLNRRAALMVWLVFAGLALVSVRDRDLWRACLYGRAADARVRHPGSARRRCRGRPGYGGRAWRETGRHGLLSAQRPLTL